MRTLSSARRLGVLVVVPLAFLWLSVSAPAAPPTEDPTGVLARAQAAADEGRFTDAERMLKEHIADPNAPVTDPYATALEVLRRIRLDYALTPDQLLAKVRNSIPDITADNLEVWRTQGALQYRLIDGEVRYFAREPGNLFRFGNEASKRRTPPFKPAGEFDLPRHIAQLLDEARGDPNGLVHPLRHRARYELRIKPGNPRLQAGAKVRAWLPFPQEYRQQRDVRLIATEPAGGVVSPAGTPQRTVYFEQTITDPNQSPRFAAEFEFTTSAYVPSLDPNAVRPYEPNSPDYQDNLAERLPHIAFTPELRTTVQEIVGAETNPLFKAQRIFHWISEHVRYCAEMEYSTIPGISTKAFTSRRGDCGVQALLFITMCRVAGVPARWQSGWETLPGDWNMHDWAEFYVEPWGWLPADPSYGLQKHSDPRVQDFYCGHLDAFRMIVNVDYGRNLVPPKTSFRSEPTDFQRGEVEIDGHNLYFNEWEWTFDFTARPVHGGLSALEEVLDAQVPQWLAREHIPGAVLAVGQKTPQGFRTWQKSYGCLELEPQKTPMPVDALFDLASMTKPTATGTCLAVLIDRGQVGVEDPVSKYLPEFREGDKAAVTVRNLMTHTSGMPPYVFADQQKKLREQHGFPCAAALRAYIRNLPLASKPGEKVVYSCLNAILCAEIVEHVSGKPLDHFFAEEVAKPLKMIDSGFNPAESLLARTEPTTKTDYGRGAGGFLRGQVHDPLAAMQAGVSGNAGLFSTAADIGRLAQMMLNRGELDGVRLLKPETVEAMTRVQNAGAVNAKGLPDRRGLLWDLYVPDPNDTGIDALFAYGHTGYTGTAIRIYPEQGVYVIALTNRVHPDDQAKVEQFRKQVWETVGEMVLLPKDRRSR